MTLNCSQFFLRLSLLCCLVGSVASAQQRAATLTGYVVDPSNALIPNATVTLHPADNTGDLSTTTDRRGRYVIQAETGTAYVLTVKALGFATYTDAAVSLVKNGHTILDVRMKVADHTEQVIVSDETRMDADPNHNGDSLTLTGKAIDDLPLDSAELLQQLQALSGGPSPDIYVDGFSNGKLPNRDTIREIHINQNPYSAMYDTNPGNGRIEVFTKPGTNQLHGDIYSFGNASALNTQNPFTSNQPSYYSYDINAHLDGALNKHISFDASAGVQTGQDNAVINAQTLDANNNEVSIHQAISAPTTTYNFSNRLDFAIRPRNTLMTRYSLGDTTQSNGGIGQLSLASQGFKGTTTTQTLQFADTTIVSPRVVNEARFQYTRLRDRQTPNSTSPTITVEGSFTGGGSATANYNDNQDRFELQNYVSISSGKQFFTVGGRFRATRDANHSLANYNGTYTFASLALLATGQPNQFSITEGNPNVVVSVADAGLFLQDDWKFRPTLTLSGGLRFETQNHIKDHADWAPRLGVAWSPGKKGKPANYTFRGGGGIFYHRFASSSILQAIRQNGVTQQQFIVSQPQFFNPDSNIGINLTGAQSQSTIYQISPNFHSPYYIATTLSVERRIGSLGSVTATWGTNRDDHTQLIRNINAPLPGTYNPAIPTSGTRPYGGTQNIYEYDSEGVSRTNRLTINTYVRFNQRFSIFGFYQLLSQRSDANETFVSNSYDIAADYGRASTDIRHMPSIVGSIALPFGLRAVTFIQGHSGAPFNITVGQDLNGDTIFNDRPAFATDMSRPSVVTTQYGAFDTNPIAGQKIIPNNYGRGPAQLSVNFSLNKSLQFGPLAGAPSPSLAAGQKTQINRKFTLDVAIDAQNLFNQVNLASPVGTLNSPLFGKSIALANQSASANRIVEISLYLRF